MQIKQFYTKHKPLCEAFFWIIMLVLVIFCWPQSTEVIVETQEIQVEIEESTPIPQIVFVSKITPTLEPEPEKEPEPILKPPRYGFTEEEIYLMAVLLCGSKDVDGDGEYDFDYGHDDRYDQISLVLCVVMNRVRSDVYPDTVSEVIWQKGQFSPMPQWNKKLPQVSDISLQRVTEWCKAYDAHDMGVQSIPEDYLYFSGNGMENFSR